MIKAIHRQARRLFGDRGGNFSILFGVSAIAIMMSAGIAVEFTRAMSEKSAMANALDAAVLATARGIAMGDLTLDTAEDYLQAVFVANMNAPASEAAGAYRVENIEFNTTTETLTATAASRFDTMFRFFGENNTQTIRTAAAATYGSNKAEVAMIFDLTGSMSGTKINALRNAAVEGVTLLLEQKAAEPRIRVSSIPYAQSVNAGPLAAYVFPDNGNDNANPPSYGQFVDETETGVGPKWFGGNFKRNGSLAGVNGASDTCATERKGDHRYDASGPDVAMVNRDGDLKYEAPPFCPSSEIIPLTSDLKTLADQFRKFSTYEMTAGHIGIQWGWYTLSHEWADYLPTDSKPADPSDETEKVQKYAIIMTDGVFNKPYAPLPERRGRANAEEISTQHALALCAAMKAESIAIFTIGFELENTRAINMLKQCATPDTPSTRYFYDTSGGRELTEAYQAIARSIQALRLVQ
ncbi:TadE/TadG family type IV pilus assembly protein [Pararhizobium haloflavum]|uniref:TadE/TadG family type IV pilus assembly protein n=1 Tax=Pararhizobium haloflavum TaxID=2037914 RepID=UPI000C18CA3F|nr:TadE/TadG family type IV pilus assembly protein [Pararhizobium haloflavum]